MYEPDYPDIVFHGTIPSTGPIIYHQFYAPQNGELTASIEWTSAQTHQTVCVMRSDFVDPAPTCATAVAGTHNVVYAGAMTGNPFVIYASPDFSADATYSIEVRVRQLKL